MLFGFETPDSCACSLLLLASGQHVAIRRPIAGSPLTADRSHQADN
jgi:hypothetical protein